MGLTVRAYHRSTEIEEHAQEILDGDIVLLPDFGPGLCMLGVNTKNEDGTFIRRRLTCAPWARLTTGEPFNLDSPDSVERDRQILAQARYLPSVAAALAIVNQSNDTIIPYYNPRFRLRDHYIPGLTRQREAYRHSPLLHAHSLGAGNRLEIIQVWYGGFEVEELTPQNFVGLIFFDGAYDLSTGWNAVHRSGPSLNHRYITADEAVYDLIRFDLAATCIGPSAATDEDPT